MTNFFGALLVVGCYAPLFLIEAFIQPGPEKVGLVLLAIIGTAATWVLPVHGARLSPVSIAPSVVVPATLPLAGYLIPYLAIPGGFWLVLLMVILMTLGSGPSQLLPSSWYLRLRGWQFYRVTIGWRTITVMSRTLPAQTVLVYGGDGLVALAPVKLRFLTNYLALVV